ncbi:MAG: NAD(P)H-hydrate dehydratase [Acidobacteria bacterium]|nr:NAD(P)H-hydrate dehydratase [Acidobacteriota bacterium]
MRSVDRRTTEEYGIAGLALMENAAMRAVEFVRARLGDPCDRRIAIACGKGNNGGDGAAVARMLVERGAEVAVLMVASAASTHGDARTNFERLVLLGRERANLTILEVEEPAALHKFGEALPQAWLIIDALLGTGLERAAEEPYTRIIEALNQARDRHRIPLLSIDLPSGLAADSERVIGPTIQADFTVTFTAPKPALVLPPACDHAGEVVTAEIGSPAELVDSLNPKLHLTGPGEVRTWLKATRRRADGHKGTYGHALLLTGSRGKCGAAVLSGLAALRSGAGLVTLAIPASLQHLPVICHPELMTEGLDEDADGRVAYSALEQIRRLTASRELLALGPGLGTGDGIRSVVQEIVGGRSGRTIIDADGLNNLAPWVRARDDRERTLILTPHPAEMGRLAGRTTEQVLARRVDLARSFATEHELILVLKGYRSLIAMPSGHVWVNPTGNAGLATAGSGDVLTGMLAGFLAAPSADVSAGVVAAVYLHGLAGELAARRFGLRGVVASDITNHLAEAIRAVSGEEGEF